MMSGQGGAGAIAMLNEQGYQQVAAYRDTPQMAVFIERIVASCGGSVTDRGGLSGLACWYSGEKSVQSLAKLCGELRQPPWASYSNPMAAQQQLNVLATGMQQAVPVQAVPVQAFPVGQGGFPVGQGMPMQQQQMQQQQMQQQQMQQQQMQQQQMQQQQQQVEKKHGGIGMGGALAIGAAALAAVGIGAAVVAGSEHHDHHHHQHGHQMCFKCQGKGWCHESSMNHDKPMNQKCFFCEECSACGGRGRQ